LSNGSTKGMLDLIEPNNCLERGRGKTTEDKEKPQKTGKEGEKGVSSPPLRP